MTFTVNSTDYSANVVAGTYKVKNDPVYAEWTDANYGKHKRKLRDKVVGSFDMFFRTLTEYENFISVLTAATTNEQTLLTVSVNNTGTTKTGNFFVTHDPVRDLDGTWNDYIMQFTLNISEA